MGERTHMTADPSGLTAVEKRVQTLLHPRFPDRAIAIFVQRVGCLPDAFEHVNQVDDDAHRAEFFALGLDARQLVLVAIHQHDPLALVLWIPSPCVAERLINDVFGLLLDARPYALVAYFGALGPRARVAHSFQVGPHIDGLAHESRHGIDGGHFAPCACVARLP